MKKIILPFFVLAMLALVVPVYAQTNMTAGNPSYIVTSQTQPTGYTTDIGITPTETTGFVAGSSIFICLPIVGTECGVWAKATPFSGTETWEVFDATWKSFYKETKSYESFECTLADGTASNCYQATWRFDVGGFMPAGTYYVRYAGGILGPYVNLRFDIGEGTIWDSVFAPLYFAGMKLPALFWLTSPIWVVLIVMGVLMIITRSISGGAKVIARFFKAGAGAARRVATAIREEVPKKAKKARSYW